MSIQERRVLPSALSEASWTASSDIPYEPVAMDPDVKVIKVGGQSIFDRGRVALMPVVTELLAAKERHKLLLMTGGGTRARHIYSIASGLEMPTGVLAKLGAYVAMQNARMLQMLTARDGGLFMLPDDFEKLPLYFRLGCLPIMMGMPPFAYWEKPVAGTRIPANRTDAGVWLTAEVLGARRALFIKDEDGLFEDDPKKNPAARHIPRISAQELIAADLPDVVVERVVLEYMLRGRHCTEIQIVNGLIPGQVTAALEGEDVGTVIYRA